MELIIKIPDELYKKLKTPRTVGLTEAFDQRATLIRAIASGTPYNPSGDLISRSELIKDMEKRCGEPFSYIKTVIPVLRAIDNAQVIPERPNCSNCKNNIFTMSDFPCSNCEGKSQPTKWEKGGAK